MTTISSRVISNLDALFGSVAQPHYAAYSEETATGCLYWKVAADYDKKWSVQVIDTWLERAREAVKDERVQVYKRVRSWMNIRTTDSNQIVVCPGGDKFDIVRYDWGAKAGVSCDADYWTKALMSLDQQYGIDITGAGYQTVEFVLRRVPTGKQAVALLRRLDKLAGCVLEGIMHTLSREFDYDNESPGQLIENYDLGDGRIALWFD